MYHSITIGEKNTWDDWHLIPTSRPLFNPPKLKENYVDIPGGDGVLDMSTALTGRPTYENRTGSWTFAVQNGFKDWAVLYSEIMAYLHGQKHRAILEDDPAYYYEGRFTVNQWKSDKNWSQIVIDYNVGPYKKVVDESGYDWLWDPFDFDTGTAGDFRDMTVSGTLTKVITLNSAMIVSIPVIETSTTGMAVVYEGVTYPLAEGKNTNHEIMLRAGDNTLTFTGNGTVSVSATRGVL